MTVTYHLSNQFRRRLLVMPLSEYYCSYKTKCCFIAPRVIMFDKDIDLVTHKLNLLFTLI